jgi:guanine deaminase
MTTSGSIAIRAKIFHFLSPDEYVFFEDGLLIVERGFVSRLGNYSELSAEIPHECMYIDERDKWIFPGFIDGHIHAVQTRVIASFGADLLQWLENYTFPAEKLFEDENYAQLETDFFFSQMLKNGTTTAAIYTSVHAQSLKAVMNKAASLNMRIMAGKTNMDRNAPPDLCEETAATFSQTEMFIQEYEGKHRLEYILTPRFAITSSHEQMLHLQELNKKFPHIKVQTHLSENHAEINETLKLFPEAKDYLGVYESYGLVNSGTLLGHAIHLSDTEWERVREHKASLIHCPTSNLFLGSGLFNLQKALDMGIPVGLGSDIGAGTSFSMLQTAAAAYQVAALRGQKTDAFKLFYLITLGGAKALGVEQKIGSFLPGKEADFLVLNPMADTMLSKKISVECSLHDKLFSFIFLGNEQIVDSVYLMGNRVI